jgi:hypothetical protein
VALLFEKGHEFDRAIQYLLLSAENAARQSAHRDSIAILPHAPTLVRKVAANTRTELGIRILDCIGDAQSAPALETEATRAALADLKKAPVRVLINLSGPAAIIDPGRSSRCIKKKIGPNCHTAHA